MWSMVPAVRAFHLTYYEKLTKFPHQGFRLFFRTKKTDENWRLRPGRFIAVWLPSPIADGPRLCNVFRKMGLFHKPNPEADCGRLDLACAEAALFCHLDEIILGIGPLEQHVSEGPLCPIGTDSFRCSRSSSATRSNSRVLAVVSPRARHREMMRSSSGLRIRALASPQRTCSVSLTDFGKHPRLGVAAPGSGSPSPKPSSRLTVDASGSKAQRGTGVLSSSRFPEPLQRRIDFPIAVDLMIV